MLARWDGCSTAAISSSVRDMPSRRDDRHGPPDAGAARRRRMRALAIVLALTSVFTVVEVVGGVIAGSLALLADAGHMLSDNLALALALGAIWLAGRPPSDRKTFGYRRAEILAALVNGVALVAVAIWIFIEAAQRLEDPPEVEAGVVLGVGAAGLAVNVTAAIILWRARGESLNLRAAFLHVAGDLAGSIGVIVAALIVLGTGWLAADPLISVLIGLLILISAWTIVREATNVLLEAAPRGLDTAELAGRVMALPGVAEVEDLHVWEISSDFPAMSAHVLVEQEVDCHQRRRDIAQMLEREYGITHSTLQLDHVGGEPPPG